MEAERADWHRMTKGGVFSNMKVVSLLIFWSLPLLQTGGHGQALSHGDAPHAESHVTSAVIQQARDVFFPGDTSRGSFGASLCNEEDSLDDVFFDTGLLFSSLWRNFGRDDLSSLARSQHDLLRSPSHPHPLRC
jgi:hypothetical protein